MAEQKILPSKEFLQGVPGLVLTHDDLREVPWIRSDNLLPADFAGSQNSQKFILKGDPESVVRITGSPFQLMHFGWQLPKFEAGVQETARLRSQFGIDVPEFEAKIVNPYLIYPDLIAVNFPEVDRQEDPVEMLHQKPADLDIYVKTEFVHGQTLDEINQFDQPLKEAVDHLGGNLVWYYTQCYLSDPNAEHVMALSDIIDPSQYMWGATASRPDQIRLYLIDLEMQARKFWITTGREGIFREISEVYWAFIRRVEEKSGVRLEHSRQQLDQAISVIAQHSPEGADYIKHLTSLENEDEYDTSVNPVPKPELP